MADFIDHMDEADKALGLSDEEKNLYRHHLKNLRGKGKVIQPNGQISTIYQMNEEIGGKHYNLPTVWNGKILSPDEARARAEKAGLDKFPSYGSEKEAEDRYQAMHQFMEKDTADYLASRKSPAQIMYPDK